MIKDIRALITVLLWLTALSAQGQNAILNSANVQNLEVSPFEVVNTPFLEFSPVMYDQGMVYVASKEIGEIYDPEINESFFDLKYFDLNSESASSVSFSTAINTTNVHKGPCAFSQQERIIYYTKERRFSDDRKAVLKIFKAYKDENDWIPDGEFPFNSDDYSTMHPAVSPDGSFMIFSSNREGGLGGYDLYISRYEDGYWQEPENLGSAINTFGNEIFPYVHESGVVFFSSDSRGGYGGLDLFVTRLEDDLWKLAENAGKPFNSASDDFGITVNAQGDYGFFTSNRKGGEGKDDIYEFNGQIGIFNEVFKEAVVEMFQFSTVVLDEETKLPVEDVEVFAIPFVINNDELVLSNFSVKSIDAVSNQEDIILNLMPRADIGDEYKRRSDLNGRTSFVLDRNRRYFLFAQKEGFQPQQTAIDAENIVPEITMLIQKEQPDVNITLVERPTSVIEEALDRRELVVFNEIYYDYNSADLKEGAMRELDLLSDYLMRYPDLRVMLTSYTDARGRRDYNMKLSGERAQSAKEYLVRKGLSDFRIIAAGRGENNIRNHCANGVSCSDEEHEYNRRTEVQILEN